MQVTRLKFSGRNDDVKALLADMKANGEKVEEVAHKFENNPHLCEMVNNLYRVKIKVED